MAKTRDQLRQALRQWRYQIPHDVQIAAAQTVADQVIAQPWFQQATTIACYLAQAGELATTYIMQAIWQQSKICYLPVLDPLPRQPLHFVQYQPDDMLAPNRYGILEPQRTSTNSCEAEALDLVLVPLVAFDAQGNRLGMGSGYYDRTFAFLKKGLRQKPILLGLAYEGQYVANLASAPWDVPLQGIVTDMRIYLAPHSA